MRLVERHILKESESVKALCFKAARLYNYCLYTIRQNYFNEGVWISEYDLSGKLAKEKQVDFVVLPAQTSQQIIKLLYQNWKSFARANKDYKKNPSKYKAKPRIPNYKDKQGYFVSVFVSKQARLKDGFIHFPEKANLSPLKTKVTSIKQVRIVPQATCFVAEVIYEKQEVHYENLKKYKFLSIDLGLNNFATSTNNIGQKPFIINGKVLKSVNQFYNKLNAKYKSLIGSKGTSKRLNRITRYRNNYIEDKLHKMSRYIVNYCLQNNIGTIVIGLNKDWKQSIDMGAKNNQKFVCLPHSRFIDKIRYKAKLVGIDVQVNEESYTSKIDHLALEPLCKQEKYLGKRKFRGLFQSSTGKLINADVNGSIGISRKVFGDSAMKQITDSWFAHNPYKINVL